jgi:predicted AlkP superfamily pyrophosphatase or phosphodiesterase
MSYLAGSRMALAATLALTAAIATTAASPSAFARDDDDRGRPAHAPWADDDDERDRKRVQRRGAAPKVVLISLDGAKPDLVETYLKTGVLPRDEGLGELRRRGVVARQNITATPSLTAVSHIAIATGSTAVNNDIPANTFHPVAASIGTGISGFAAPIGGYDIHTPDPPGASASPTAEPLWVRLRKAGKSVVTATWPGADGADIRIGGALVQAADPTRITDFTVPFGAFGGIGAVGFVKTAGDFAADAAVAAQLAAAGRTSFSPVLATVAPFETFHCASTTAGTCGTTASATLDLPFEMRAAVLDTTDDGAVNYDVVVFFEKTKGIQPGPFALPATGPAYARVGRRSGKFFFDGTGNKIGAAYFASLVAPDLSTVRFARYGANFIPRNAPVIDDVDDINANVGFWAPQPDFRIPERISPGFGPFPDLELEAMYEDQVKTFVRYQTRVAQRAIANTPGADLAMIYIEQPDGSGHQFTLTDPRQASNFLDPTTIGPNQDAAKVARYADYLKFAYRQANEAVAEIMEMVGPSANVFVVSDHGMAPFHTAVSMLNLLRNAGIDTTKIGIRTNGPAVNIYVNLQGREAGGTVTAAEYQALVPQIAAVVQSAQDPNPTFNYSLAGGRIFTTVATRPLSCADGVGFCTSDDIGQDFGDVFAIMAEGYNFDGIQNPGVARQGDPPFNAATTVFSAPNFYGAHGHDSSLPSMSASFLAAGPDIKRGKTVSLVHNIDVAPTIMRLLGVEPAETVDGRVLSEILK